MKCAYDNDRICNASCVAYGNRTDNTEKVTPKLRSPTPITPSRGNASDKYCKRGNFSI